MKSEISLFLVAGLFGILASSVLIGINFKLPFLIFDYKVASIVLFIFILLAFIGIHPIISISILGDFFSKCKSYTSGNDIFNGMGNNSFDITNFRFKSYNEC